MSGFLDNYEDVAARIQRWWTTHPQGRLETRIVEFNATSGFVLVEAKAFREFEDTQPAGVDYAFGSVATYNVQMKKFFVEDTSTSAIGRVIGLVLGTDKRPTRQDMEKVETMPAKAVQATANDEDPWSKPFTSTEGVTASEAINEIQTQLGGELVAEAPMCDHGHRIRKEGTKKDGSAYMGYACASKLKSDKCTPDIIWYNLVGGSWQPQVKKAWN